MATEIAKYPFKVQGPAHITPGITKNLLLSIGQFAATNYATIFDKEEVNIYNANDTIMQSQEEPSYKGGGMLQRSCGASHSWLWSETTILPPSL